MVISQKKAVRKKLMAATSMLLVACIMLISASYAWFTLSTAPEITGITTAVGANGNLEIALASGSTWGDPDSTVQSNVGSSLASSSDGQSNAVIANETWGNLLDVSKYYGLEGFSLLPSRLSVTGNETDGYAINSAFPLLTPSYGTDGRVSELVGNTDYAVYNSTTHDYTKTESDYGVRIIGAAAGMTDRQLAYRSAKVDLANAISQARSYAKGSLENNGTALANIVMQKAVNEAPTFKKVDVDAINAVVSALASAQQRMLVAWEKAVIAYAASHSGESITGLSTESDYLAFKAKVDAKNYTVDNSANTITANDVTLTLPADFSTYYTKVNDVGTKIESAQNGITSLLATLGNDESATVTWAQMTTVLNYIIIADSITVNNIPASQVKSKLSDLLSEVLSGGGIQVQMPTGSGIYADIADFCEDYFATVQLKNITYQDVTLGTDEKPINARMTTKTTVGTSYFTAATNAVNNAGAPTGSGAASNKLTDFYGYTLDFYLRTNATNANLELEVDGAQRIYSDSANPETQGAGCNMTFTSSDVNFTAIQMENLMKAIRVVFTDGSGKILGVAALDMADTTKPDKTTVEAPLKLCNYTVRTDGQTSSLVWTDADTAEAGLQISFKADSEQKLTALTQNAATKVSATVLLDGDYVDNSMVANAMQSMTGSMNLQFKTDVDLVPMDDTALKGEVNSTNNNQGSGN